MQSFKITRERSSNDPVTKTETNIGNMISFMGTSIKLIEYRWIIGKIANKNGWKILVLEIFINFILWLAINTLNRKSS